MRKICKISLLIILLTFNCFGGALTINCNFTNIVVRLDNSEDLVNWTFLTNTALPFEIINEQTQEFFRSELLDTYNLTLGWDINTNYDDVSGYIIVYGTGSYQYSNSITVYAPANEITLSNLDSYITYYFNILDFDGNTNFSDFSQEISFNLSSNVLILYIRR